MKAHHEAHSEPCTFAALLQDIQMQAVQIVACCGHLWNAANNPSWVGLKQLISLIQLLDIVLINLNPIVSCIPDSNCGCFQLCCWSTSGARTMQLFC